MAPVGEKLPASGKYYAKMITHLMYRKSRYQTRTRTLYERKSVVFFLQKIKVFFG